MSGKHALLAPGASSSSVSARLPGYGERLPSVDQRLVAPEQPFEAVDGNVIEMMGANEPHATTSGRLAYVLGAAVRDGYSFAVDMLTRVDRYSDFAPDASVFPSERDPQTGGRQLEELVFEVRDTQALSAVERKAELLCRRGVRRVFCVEVPEQRVLEWDAKGGRWRDLGGGAVTDAQCLVTPISTAALLQAAAADIVVGEAMVIKKPEPVRRALDESHEAGRLKGHADGLREGIDRGRADGLKEGIDKGRADGLREGQLLEARKSLRRVLSRRGFTLTPAQEALIDGCGDLAELERWFDNAITAPSADEALA